MVSRHPIFLLVTEKHYADTIDRREAGWRLAAAEVLVIITSGCRLRKVARSLPENGQLAPSVSQKQLWLQRFTFSNQESTGPVLSVALRVPRVLTAIVRKIRNPCVDFILPVYKSFIAILSPCYAVYLFGFPFGNYIKTMVLRSMVFLMKVLRRVWRGRELTRGELKVKSALCLQRCSRPLFIRLNINKYLTSINYCVKRSNEQPIHVQFLREYNFI